MKRIACILIFLLLSLFSFAQLPAVSSGTIVRHENFHSKYVWPRNIDVWLPEGYSDKKKYAVLYMQDGQMLFDDSKTWNKQAWHVDEAVALLLKNNQIRDCIIVGIWNNTYRWFEYFPAKAYAFIPKRWQDSLTLRSETKDMRPVSDEYLKFMVTELKPFIDSAYSTQKDRANTYIAGSSMGGLISMYAVCEYPQVFGGAACLSTHWPGASEQDSMIIGKAIIRYMQGKLPAPATHRFYFDHGTVGLDQYYEPYQQKVDAMMKAKGYDNKNLLSLKFAGADHSEKAWGRRLGAPLYFLLRK